MFWWCFRDMLVMCWWWFKYMFMIFLTFIGKQIRNICDDIFVTYIVLIGFPNRICYSAFNINHFGSSEFCSSSANAQSLCAHKTHCIFLGHAFFSSSLSRSAIVLHSGSLHLHIVIGLRRSIWRMRERGMPGLFSHWVSGSAGTAVLIMVYQ